MRRNQICGSSSLWGQSLTWEVAAAATGEVNLHESCLQDQRKLAKTKGLLGTHPMKNKNWKPL
jgi:hypothetical protein